MESRSEEVTDVDSRNIRILNDYCLLHIFEYLSIDDKLNAEEVCERWKELCQKVWCQYQFKNLCVEREAWNLPCKLLDNDSTSEKILLRLARYITSIDLSRPFPGIEKQEISIHILLNVLKKCHKIDTFFLTYPFDADSALIQELINWLKHYAPQLRKFGYCHQTFLFSDDILFGLFSSMKNLSLLFIDSIVGERFIEHIPDSVEAILLENCGQIEVNSVLSVVTKMNKMQTFCSSGLIANDDLYFDKNSSIRNLGVTMCFSANDPKWSLSVCQLKNIEKLNIELNDNIDDDFLYNLSIYCRKIVFLNFSGCSYVTDVGLKHLKSLPNLNFLALASITGLSGKNLGTIPNLEVLDCKNCPDMTDEGLLDIVKFSNGLRILNISGCKSLTKNLIWSAVHVTRRRENDVILYISTERTSIKPREFKHKSRFLRLKYQILCRIDCTSNYNGYFPTIHNFFSCSKQRDVENGTKVYTFLKMD